MGGASVPLFLCSGHGHGRLPRMADGCEAGPQRTGVALYWQRQRVYTEQV